MFAVTYNKDFVKIVLLGFRITDIEICNDELGNNINRLNNR